MFILKKYPFTELLHNQSQATKLRINLSLVLFG